MYQIQNLQQFQQSFAQVQAIAMQVEREAAARAKLTQPCCSNCVWYTGETLLPCTVQPLIADQGVHLRNDCTDWRLNTDPLNRCRA